MRVAWTVFFVAACVFTFAPHQTHPLGVYRWAYCEGMCWGVAATLVTLMGSRRKP